MPLHSISKGKKFHVVAYSPREDKSSVLEFLHNGAGKDASRLAALLDRTAEHGKPCNTEKFKQLQDKIYEFKSGQARLTCFFHENQIIVCVHGFTKKKPKTDAADIKKAEQMRQQFLKELSQTNQN